MHSPRVLRCCWRGEGVVFHWFTGNASPTMPSLGTRRAPRHHSSRQDRNARVQHAWRPIDLQVEADKRTREISTVANGRPQHGGGDRRIKRWKWTELGSSHPFQLVASHAHPPRYCKRASQEGDSGRLDWPSDRSEAS
eukprot:scaffold1245_cov252-Pinguiococcus_pyrenoidosus.AAC.14